VLLGRQPQGQFEVVVRDRRGHPVVIRNSPLLDDGTPMPTRYWLVGKTEKRAVDRLEASGGCRAAEAAVDRVELEQAHRRYATERDAALPPGWTGARPSGGVGGTQRGVKCLHAHYAWYLAGGKDPVGAWVAGRLQVAEGPQAELRAQEAEGHDAAEPVPKGPEGRVLVPGAPVGGDATSRAAVGGNGPARKAPKRASKGNVAAVDCGTLSTRLLVTSSSGKTLARLAHITRLGEGVDRSGHIHPGAVERTLSVLRDYRDVMDQLGVRRARMVGTSALRDSANRATFSKPASDVIGTELELLSGEQEASLSFIGATEELDGSGAPWLVVDIGGGSTEMALGWQPGRPPVAARSLDLGCVRVSERFLHSDPPTEVELVTASRWLHEQYSQAEAGLTRLREARVLVGLAGTVSALACFDQGLTTYQRDAVHHYHLRRKRVEEALADLAAQPATLRSQRPGIEEARTDAIVGGIVVLSTLMSHFGFEECLVSESDILDGLAASLR
jgi:exopolyphosphatase/guanosine-5'-triphosphate,3'-diphosphate pyrophosphatase